MKPSEAIKDKMPEIRALVKHFGFKNPRIYGSVLSQTDTESSDLDIVVEKTPLVKGMLQLGSLSYALSELLGVDVDVKTVEMIPDKVKHDIMSNGMQI
jgi:uncharacterized protein